MWSNYGYWNGYSWVYPTHYGYPTYISHVPGTVPDPQARVTEQLLKRIADLEARLDSK